MLEGNLARAAQELGAALPDDFPPEGAKRFFALRLSQMQENELFEVWCPHAVVVDGRMIGHAGYHGPPGVNAYKRADAVEIGYAIEPDFRGRGYATAAAGELIRQAEERGIAHVIASCAPDNGASLAVVRKLGFTQTGEVIDEEDGLELVFELEQSAGRD